MWACVLKFENGNSSPMYSQSKDGLWMAIDYVIKTWNAPVREIYFHRMDSVREIKQGRINQYVKAD